MRTMCNIFSEFRLPCCSRYVLIKTARFADVILPAAPSLEKEGTFTNTERRIQRLYEVLKPLGDSKPDWWILQKLLVHSAGLELRKSK